MKYFFLLVLAPLSVFNCSVPTTMHSRFTPLEQSYEALPENFDVEIFPSNAPSKSFRKIARLDVHIEKTFLTVPILQDALPELKRQARLAGAHAIIEIQEQRSEHGETKMYHVTAYGIRFDDR